MNYRQISHPKKILKRLLKGPKIQYLGIFWVAYASLKDGKPDFAQSILKEEYFPTKSGTQQDERLNMIYSISSGLPPDPDDFGWVELFAAAGLNQTLCDLYQAGKVDAIYAVHADIELGTCFFPNTTLRVTPDEMQRLIALYDIESELIDGTSHSNHHLRKWLDERRERAIAYADVLELCHDLYPEDDD